MRVSSRSWVVAAHLITHMAGQEARHLQTFERLLSTRRIRPTLLEPIWTIAGFALGALSALASPRAAMAVTAAVETEIDAHYGAQSALLGQHDAELAHHIEDFRADEAEHRDTALANDAAATPGYPLFEVLVRAGCRVAIAASERI